MKLISQSTRKDDKLDAQMLARRLAALWQTGEVYEPLRNSRAPGSETESRLKDFDFLANR